MTTTATNTSGTNASDCCPSPSKEEAITWGALFALEAFLIVVGNALAAATFSKTRQLRRRSLFLVMNLVAADLLVGVLAIPCWIYVSFGWALHQARRRHSASFFHLLFSIIDMLSSFASIGCMVSLSVERLHATFRPLRHRLVPRGFYLACIVSLWVLALFPIPLRLEIYYGRVKSPSLVAWMPIQLALLLFICAAYLSIWIKIRFGATPNGLHSRDRKLTMVLIVVAVVSLFAWLPFIVLNIIYIVDAALYHHRALYSIKLLHYGNSLVNPIIYPYRMPVFRRALVRLICGPSRQVNPLRVTAGTTPKNVSTVPEESTAT